MPCSETSPVVEDVSLREAEGQHRHVVHELHEGDAKYNPVPLSPLQETHDNVLTRRCPRENYMIVAIGWALANKQTSRGGGTDAVPTSINNAEVQIPAAVGKHDSP